MSLPHKFLSPGLAPLGHTSYLFRDRRMYKFLLHARLHSDCVFSRHAKRTIENSAGGDVVFTESDLREINQVIENLDANMSSKILP